MMRPALAALAAGLLALSAPPAGAQSAAPGPGEPALTPPVAPAPSAVPPPAAVVGTTPDSANAPAVRSGPGDGTSGTRLPAVDNPVGQTRAGQGGGG